MSIKPIDMMMTIANSQTIKPHDSDQAIRHMTQAQHLVDQNIKHKESVSRIPEEENHTEIMDTIKQGMTDTNGEFHPHDNKKSHEEKEYPEKALLDEDNGHSLDIIG
ncbi:MAG: hypothetical protein ACRC0X_07315 [Brevinema sp.]